LLIFFERVTVDSSSTISAYQRETSLFRSTLLW